MNKQKVVETQSLSIDYYAARRGFIRAIILAFVVGLLVAFLVGLVLVVIGRSVWWRLTFNVCVYVVVGLVLGYLVYRIAVNNWLKAHASGRVRTISELATEAVYSVDPDTRISSWSKGAQQVFGYTSPEVLGEPASMILSEEFMDPDTDMMRKLNREGIVTRHDTVMKRKDGQVFPAEASVILLRSEDGEPSGVLTVLRDMSQQVQIEEELKKFHDRMEERAGGAPEGRGDAETGGHDAIRSTVDTMVRTLSAVAERRDPYTAGHQRRVAHLATAIAEEMGLSEEQMEGVRVAGMLHDTGKVVIPGEILSKPGSLSEFEYEIIKTHPRADYEIIEGVHFPWPIAKAVLQHHERMDGSGYPDGLEGEDIIMEARILGVADVVEAMASHRPYRPARGIDEALGEVEQNKGRLYDPDVCEACVRLFVERGYRLG